MRALVVAKEIAKNLLMGAPAFRRLRSRWRGGRTTGRLDVPAALAEVRKTVELYLSRLEGAGYSREFVKGASVLEVGPGANAGVALCLLALGARRVFLVDRFADLQCRDRERELYRALLAPAELPSALRDRLVAEAMDPSAAANEHIRFVHAPVESLALAEPVDLVVSRYVLQHLSDIGAAFDRFSALISPSGLMTHYVDVETLGPLNPGGVAPLALLELSPRTWNWMGGHRGLTNQARLGSYLAHLARAGFRLKRLEIAKRMPMGAVAAARPRLHAAFRGCSDEDLAALHFSFVAAR